MVVSWNRPTLYNLTNDLIWPEVIHRARSHPEEVTWRDANGGTALHHSCRFHYSLDVVREMLNSSHHAASMQDKSGKTPLHIACWSGSSEIIRLLLLTNKDVASIPDNRGRTPLHHACSAVSLPCVDTIKRLIQADPNVSLVTDDAGQTPLSLLCERHESRLKTANITMDNGGNADMIYSHILRPFWDQLRALLNGATSSSKTSNTPVWRLVHALTTIPDCPTMLFDLALKMHPEQVLEQIDGSFPLHHAAECPTSVRRSCNIGKSLQNTAALDDNNNNDDGYYVCTLLSLFPEACQVPDAIGRFPLHLAVASGKTYHAVLQHLFRAFPDALLDGHMPLALLAAAASHQCTSSSARRNRHVRHQSAQQQLDSILELLRLDPSGIKLAAAAAAQ